MILTLNAAVQAFIVVFSIICDPLQQKVPKDPCYMLLVWYKHHSEISRVYALLRHSEPALH